MIACRATCSQIQRFLPGSCWSYLAPVDGIAERSVGCEVFDFIHFSRIRFLVSSLVSKIVSGGQTGVDRAALDVAIELKIDHGGWCPLGRRSEDGPIDERYQLSEVDASDYTVRTERNVIDSDGTLILHFGALSGGTRLTWKLAHKHQRPVLKIDLQSHSPALTVPSLQDWIEHQEIKTLNVAGPRESTVPGIGDRVRDFLSTVFGTD